MPRLWTRPLRKLTPKTSLGFDAIEFADWLWEQLQIQAELRGEPEIAEYLPKLLEWQRWLLIHALELMPGPDMIFRFRTVLLLVARQNGKTVLMVYLILWRLFNDGAKLIIGTAQTVEIAEEAWELAVAVAEAIPELEQEIAQQRGIVRRAGKFALQLETRERYKLAAASRRGGRGLSGGELVLLDELREHQTWNSWSAVSKTTLAKKRAQVWGFSNAGDASSVVLSYLRKMALRAMGTPEALAALKAAGVSLELTAEDEREDVASDSIFLAEWSAPEGSSKWDRDGWAAANPSMGHTGLDERAIAAACATDPEWIFRTEVMCEFVNMVGKGPFPNGAWAGTLEPVVQRAKKRGGAYCIDMSADRKMVHVSVAFWDKDGRRRVEIAASRAGTEWVVPWLTSKKRRIAVTHLALQKRGAPIASEWEALEKAGDKHGFELVEFQLSAWTGQFYDAISRAVSDDDELRETVLTHGAQPILDLAANTAAIKALGDGGWTIDRTNSPEDAAPLMAAIGAHGLLLSAPEPPATSAYEEHDLLVV